MSLFILSNFYMCLSAFPSHSPPTFTITWWRSMMMMVMYRRRRGEAGKPSFKFSSVDYLARERKQLTDPALLLAGAMSKFLFTNLAGKIEPELDIGALLRPNFFPPLRQQSSPTLNLMNAKLFPPSGLPWEQSGNCLLRLSEVHNCLLQKTSDSVKKKKGRNTLR